MFKPSKRTPDEEPRHLRERIRHVIDIGQDAEFIGTTVDRLWWNRSTIQRIASAVVGFVATASAFLGGLPFWIWPFFLPVTCFLGLAAAERYERYRLAHSERQRSEASSEVEDNLGEGGEPDEELSWDPDSDLLLRTLAESPATAFELSQAFRALPGFEWVV